MSSLTVRSQVAPENRVEYSQYQQSVAVIEAEQEKRQAHPTIAMQDTTHYVW